MGIGVADLIDHETGLVENSRDFDGKNINLKELIKDRIPYPLFYDNPTRLMSKGEKELCIYKKESNFAVINIGYGIATGLVINDSHLYGNKGFTEEIAHVQIQPNGLIKCKCGNYGCLEALASGRKIAEMGQERLLMKNIQKIKELAGLKKYYR